MKLIVKIGDKKLIKQAMDEFEQKALTVLGNEFGYNTAIPTNTYIFKDALMVLVDDLIYYGEYLVASDVLRFAEIIANSDEWMVIK